MNIRILIYMNPLVVDKISKKFLWYKDSGFLYTKQLIQSLPKHWRFTILTPKGFDRTFFDSDHIIECIEYDYSTSIHQNRYHFNRNILAKTLPYSKDIDIVLNMQPEVSANLRVFFINQRREKPIIVNFFHWIDCDESRKYANDLGGYILRQVEGFNHADINLFHNKYAESLFFKSVSDNNLMNYIKQIRTGIFHPKPTIYGIAPMESTDKKVILFNHRLNNTTGWKEVLEIFNDIGDDRYVLWFTDENNLQENKSLEKMNNVVVKTIPFENYGYMLNKAHFTVCNLQDYATWNMAVLDSINHGTQVISNNTKLMSELGANINDDLHVAMSNAMNNEKIIPRERIITDFNLQEFLEDEINERIKNKNPKKYNDVYSLINNSKQCEKKEFINKFWSFHANSNFQIIRWKLLSNGVIDDVTEAYTTYHSI